MLKPLRIASLLLLALLLPDLATAQRFTSVTLVTSATGTQQIILRDSDGSNPRRIAVSNLVPNAVTDVSLSGSTLTFTYADGTTETAAIPSSGTIADNSVAAIKARATSAAHRREWQNRLGVPDDWSEIANGTAIALGKVVEHGGAYFGAITAHSKSSTGPDGDAANWTLLSSFYSDWSNAWYPAGAFVVHNSLPWVAGSAVVLNDPAPGASNNTKWIQLGSSPPTVVNVSADTSIPATADGDSYRVTGTTARTITLPNPASIDVGFYVTILNGSTATAHTISRQGASQTVEGGNTISLAAGEAVTLQLVNTGEWERIADTVRGGSAFSPSKSNLYDSVKAIFSHNTAISPDDANNELDVSVGAAASLADNSILPAKAQAGTTAQKKAWRARLASSRIGQVSAALPAVSDYNAGDLLIVGRGGTTTVTFVDVDAPGAQLTTTVAGDLVMVLSNRWTRLGNLFSGGIAAAAARAVADANAVRVNRMTVFETAILNPAGIPDNEFPQFLGLALINKIDPRRIVSIRVRIGGEQAAAAVTTESLTPFNDTGSGQLTQPGRGGVLNLVLGSSARVNLRNASPSSVQFVLGEIEYKFEGTSLQPDVLPDVTDHFVFAVNNNGYPAIAGLTESQVDARVQALRTLVSTAATPAAPDRFFFSDEDQSGDPLRYVSMSSLATAMGVKTRFSTAIGSSPVVLPTGTTHIEGVLLDNNRYIPFRFQVRAFTSTSRNYIAFGAGNLQSSNSGGLSIQYVAATRTFTYSVYGQDATLVSGSLYALGEN